MNYYPFHLGDYAAHTGHLEPMEDLAYRRLLDQYYLREGALPADIQMTAKLIRMRSYAQDVEAVLREFFDLTESGWQHVRCEEEIAKMREKQEASEERDTHEKTRQQKHRERRAQLFAQLTDVGVYPAWNAKTSELERLISEHCDKPVTPASSNGVTAPVTAPVTPETPKTSQHGQPATAIPIPTPTPTPTPIPDIESAATQRPSRPKKPETTLQTFLETCKAAGIKPIPADHSIRAYCRDAGITDEMLQVAWCVFRDDHLTGTNKAKRKKDWPGHFGNAVRGGWSKLWYTDDGEVKWTSRGLMEKGVLDTRAKAREDAHASG